MSKSRNAKDEHKTPLLLKHSSSHKSKPHKPPHQPLDSPVRDIESPKARRTQDRRASFFQSTKDDFPLDDYHTKFLTFDHVADEGKAQGKYPNKSRWSIFLWLALLVTINATVEMHFSGLIVLLLDPARLAAFVAEEIEIEKWFFLLVYIGGMCGGFLADARFGRTNTVLGSLVICFIGQAMLLVSLVFISKVEVKTVCFISGSLCVGAGTGVFEAIIYPYLLDQTFILTDSYSNYITNMFYWSKTLGFILGIIALNPETQMDMKIPFIVFPVLSLACIVIVLIGYKRLEDYKPKFNILVSFFKIIRSAISNKLTSTTSEMDTLVIQPRDWLDWAKIENDPDLVDDLRDFLKFSLVMSITPLYWLVSFGLNYLWREQCVLFFPAMDGYNLTYYRPIAVLVVLILLVPLTTYLRLQTLTKFWIGLVFLFFSSLIGLSLQLLTPTIQSPSFLIQVPSFVGIAIGESFCSTSLFEMCYSKSPETMKTLLFGWFGATIGIGQGLFQAFKICTALIPVKAVPFSILAFVILLYGLLMKLSFPASPETYQYDKNDSSDHPIDDDSPELHLEDTDDVIYYSDSDQDSEIN